MRRFRQLKLTVGIVLLFHNPGGFLKHNFIRSLFAISALFVATSCQDRKTDAPNPDGKFAGNIVGGVVGSESFQKENGIVSLVIVTENNQGICTGTLISKRLVLTAAHCLDSSLKKIKSVAVVFANDVSKATEDQILFGVQAALHPEFKKVFLGMQTGSWHDIALIRLNKDAPSDFKFASVATTNFSDQLSQSTKIIQAGFGRTTAENSVAQNSEANDEKMGVLRLVENIEIVGLAPDRKEILLKEDNKGSCKGDSGGPAFVRTSGNKLVQIGVNSRGTNPRNCLEVGVYTLVEAHTEWISETSAKLLSAAAAQVEQQHEPRVVAQNQ